MDFPTEHWKQISSTNPLERLNKEINRRTRVVGIFPDEKSLIRLIGAVLAEQNDEWAVSRRYMSRHSLGPHLPVINPGDRRRGHPRRCHSHPLTTKLEDLREHDGSYTTSWDATGFGPRGAWKSSGS